MASLDSLVLKGGEEKLEKIENFEAYIKNKLLWSREKWIKEGLLNTGMYKFVNSFHYWARELEQAQTVNSIIFTLYGEDGGTEISLEFVIDAILKIKGDTKIKAFSEFRNPKFIAIYFEDEEARKLIEQNLTYICDKHVAYIGWALGPSVKNVQIKWLPYHIDMLLLKEELNKYFEILEEEREHRRILSGLEFPTGKVCFKVLLKEGINIDDVPALVKINGLDSLWSVQGKPIICFTCSRKGHKSANCMTPFCGVCKALKPKEHLCLERGEAIVNGAGVVHENKKLICDKSDSEGSLINMGGFGFDLDNEKQNLEFNDRNAGAQVENDGKQMSGESSEEDNVMDEDNEAVSLFQNYIQELKQFQNIEANVGSGEKIGKEEGKQQITEHKEKKEGEQGMNDLKRKLELAQVPWSIPQQLGLSSKTYSRRRKDKEKKKENSNLFQLSNVENG